MAHRIEDPGDIRLDLPRVRRPGHFRHDAEDERGVGQNDADIVLGGIGAVGSDFVSHRDARRNASRNAEVEFGLTQVVDQGLIDGRRFLPEMVQVNRVQTQVKGAGAVPAAERLAGVVLVGYRLPVIDGAADLAQERIDPVDACLLYTSDAADE